MHDDRNTSRGAFEDPTGRMIPQPILGLNPEDIAAKKNGNYLLSFGFPGSGKTTFQWMMMNYLMNEGGFNPTIKVPDGPKGPDWDGRQIINSWKDQWVQGRFPEPTRSSENDIREISVHAATTSGKKLSVDFSFLEVSGELLKMAMPEDGHVPRLGDVLEAYLGNPRLKFTLMLMLHPDVEENDQLFPSFISFLDREFPNLRDRMSLGVIVSKPEESLKRLNMYGSVTGQQGFRRFDEEALETYLNRFCGETFQILETWPDQKKTLLAPLYLGRTEDSGGAIRLVSPDFNHIEQIFLWLFEQFSGERPGPTLWQRLVGKVDWK